LKLANQNNVFIMYVFVNPDGMTEKKLNFSPDGNGILFIVLRKCPSTGSGRHNNKKI
jgi:hypothetical protein